MNNEQHLQQQLKLEYEAQKRQQPLTNNELSQFKSALKDHKSKPLLPRFQWACACVAAAFLCHFVFTTYQSESLPLYTLELDKFNQVEKHELNHGQYQRAFITRKAKLDDALVTSKSTLVQIHGNQGRLIQIANNTWFIADCKEKLLLEVSADIVKQVTDKQSFNKATQGVLIAFDRNEKGQLVHITTLENSTSTQCG